MSATPSKTFLVCHGAWSAGWAWKKMHPLMQAAGHRLVTPTYTGLGERAHLANPSIDLDSHVEDVLNVIKYEDLRDIVLIADAGTGKVRRLARAAEPDAAGYVTGGCRMALNAPRRHADQMFRDQAQTDGRTADAAAQLHLRHPHHAGRHVRAVRQNDEG